MEKKVKMKVALNTQSADLINYFTRASKILGQENKRVELQASRIESGLFEVIGNSSIDAYLLEVPTPYSKKALDFVKKKNPYVPVILFGPMEALTEISGADIYLPFYPNTSKEALESQVSKFFQLVIWNASNYIRNFEKLHKLTTKMSDVIQFGQCKYDPTRRTLLYKESEVRRLSAKEGGIIEILASNFGEVVKKEVILEKVWHSSNYFNGRSMDVYVTHLRALFKDNDIDINIKNISGVGLILE
jgi:DNA-binding winged helix-turn-helix (wHTH) protein